MTRITQRVYGIVINERNEVLISDEYRFGRYFRKFPGGGIELGEGIIDGLKREFQEELGSEVKSYEFLFFNDYFQKSSFDTQTQVTCFYYLVECTNTNKLGLESYKVPLTRDGEQQQWISLHQLEPNALTFPIDQDALRVFKKKLASTS